MSIVETIKRDVTATLTRDPAARNRLEVVLLYPGFHAVLIHRVSHVLWERGLRLPARILSALAYRFTQVDIHPGATIGPGFFIDHASGVVIGETAVVGHDVTLYHQVTLGGRGDQTGKRHPNIGDRVVIGSGAKVLGAINVGADSRIGANAVVVRDCPPNSVVVGVPGQIVSTPPSYARLPSVERAGLDMPDAIGEGLKSLIDRVDEIESSMEEMTQMHSSSHHIRPNSDGFWSFEDFSI
ncbi:MAG: serine O-acetyltransferase [Actinomycetota bacterium]|nr:serine O-acetyltransferase [Actinomycetota bacterium]